MELTPGGYMKTYTVVWAIEVEADNPTEAAVQAQIIQRDPESEAQVFDVRLWHESTLDTKALGFVGVDLL